jgi:hypothetical protein
MAERRPECLPTEARWGRYVFLRILWPVSASRFPHEVFESQKMKEAQRASHLWCVSRPVHTGMGPRDTIKAPLYSGQITYR